jgi:hypothetical protein
VSRVCYADEVVSDPSLVRPTSAEDTGGAEPPTWATWREPIGVVCHHPHLRKMAAIALVVGTVLFAINQLDVVLRGDATTVVWIKSAVTHVVPFVVSNLGVLVASRVDRHDGTRA